MVRWYSICNLLISCQNMVAIHEIFCDSRAVLIYLIVIWMRPICDKLFVRFARFCQLALAGLRQKSIDSETNACGSAGIFDPHNQGFRLVFVYSLAFPNLSRLQYNTSRPEFCLSLSFATSFCSYPTELRYCAWQNCRNKLL